MKPGALVRLYCNMQTFIFESNAGPDGASRWATELANLRAAQVEAIRCLGELLSDDGEAFWEDEAVSMTVSDAHGLILFSLELGAVRAPALALSARA